ncbi:MAG: MBL fold metallo-hydrolase, partial [Romboutsia sp.]|nr:MBL fold metallo-hydrolase [Romboutsia sp.]
LKIILHILIKVYKNKLTTQDYNLLNTYSFEDERLKEKSKVILVYIKKCIGDISWKFEIDNVNIKKHYLGMLIYLEKMQLNKDFKIDEFFDKYFEYHSDRHQIINSYWNSRPRRVKKDLSNIKIKFIGGTDKIGGSCILIQHKDTNILLDAGANIHGEYYPDFSTLEEENIQLKDIDYLIISHSHFDHIGSLPYIYKQNNNIKIITTFQTKDIMKVMLEECERANIEEEKISSQDIKNVLSNVIVKPMNSEIKINNDIKLNLFSAGHILGAVAIYLKVEDVGLLYTGDYCVHDQYTVKGMSLPLDLEVDVLITESTYAYYPSNFNLSKENQEKLFIDDITRVINNNGIVLIPAFAIGRAQEIVMTIKNYFKDEVFLPFDVYLDGKVVEICDVYEKYLNVNKKDLYENGISKVNHKRKNNDEYLLEKYRGSCIIASSGMLNENSRSSKYANAIVNDEKSLILFSGYLDEESPGKQLLKKINEEVMPTINIEGNTKEVLCNVKSYKMSAHVKKYELLKLMIKLKPQYTFLVHGDSTNKYKYMNDENLGEQIYPKIETLMYYINDTDIIVPKNGELYKFD